MLYSTSSRCTYTSIGNFTHFFNSDSNLISKHQARLSSIILIAFVSRQLITNYRAYFFYERASYKIQEEKLEEHKDSNRKSYSCPRSKICWKVSNIGYNARSNRDFFASYNNFQIIFQRKQLVEYFGVGIFTQWLVLSPP